METVTSDRHNLIQFALIWYHIPKDTQELYSITVTAFKKQAYADNLTLLNLNAVETQHTLNLLNKWLQC